ncbi:MAG: N-acetylmuramoyl-L-alanine amidase [Bradyrhizobium sp.]|uniref:N-acetylmuramoyl-L-alanine amidase family protein n=1 Tax=Bradyrhizobium sp. TaxID=376 RepID=UPI002717A96F|nr:N-acetylmuramoyl-L-alanine amidase [Bradyrhizobium sp.]MDO8399335.1 N-acetylmuramoyl-L-alanine amidase [Bradyrhizobium sp.]
MVLLPVEASDAGWLSDVFKGSSKPDKSAKQATSPKRATVAKRAPKVKPATPAGSAASPKPRNVRLAALGPVSLSPSAFQPAGPTCDPAKFRIVVDVGHTAESGGANSARNVAEFLYNHRLARRIEQTLKADGFTETRLLLTEGKARHSLVKRVAAANALQANLFLSIHHDSVPTKFLEEWEFDGKKSRFSDRFGGYSVFVSRQNPDFRTSLAFAELVAKEMKAFGLPYAEQYSQPIMGRHRHPLLNKETGVYSYDELVVLRKTRMPAVLLEAGSIINRDEELVMDSRERQDIISTGVTAAVKQFCDRRWAILGPL